jgi:hypothetical protein
MKLHTASEIISLAKQLESESGNFYKDLSEKYPTDEGVFLSLAKENERNITQIERVYYGAITDAIEGCFAFDMDPDEYMFNTALAANASYSDALEEAVEMEQKIIKFYSDAAEQSKSLMADMPRAFKIVVKKRNDRRLRLASLLKNKG